MDEKVKKHWLFSMLGASWFNWHTPDAHNFKPTEREEKSSGQRRRDKNRRKMARRSRRTNRLYREYHKIG